MRTAALASLVAAACRSVGSDDTAEDVPALIVEPTDAVMAELLEVVESAMPGRRILLADDALTKSSLLVVERRRHERLDGTLSAGVADEAPHRFRLVLRDQYTTPADSRQGTRETAAAVGCELVHLNTGKRHALQATRCRVEPQASGLRHPSD